MFWKSELIKRAVEQLEAKRAKGAVEQLDKLIIKRAKWGYYICHS